MSPPLNPSVGPKHDLAQIQKDVDDPSYRFSPDIAQDIRDSLGDLAIEECHRHVRRLVCSLTNDDFAGVDCWSGRPSGLVQADVYGKQDEHGRWYVKVGIHKERTRIYSCHHLLKDLTLKTGTVLRKTR